MRCSPSWSRGAALSGYVATVFLGGGTPTFTDPAPRGCSRTFRPRPRPRVEANPETVTLGLRRRCCGSTASTASPSAHRASKPHLLETLERSAWKDTPAARMHTLRRGGSTMPRLRDPGSERRPGTATSPRRLRSSRSTAPPRAGGEARHPLHARTRRKELSVRPTRRGGLLRTGRRDADGAGYRWYETANFCRLDCWSRPAFAPQSRLLACRDYLGIGVGAFRHRSPPTVETAPTPIPR